MTLADAIAQARDSVRGTRSVHWDVVHVLLTALDASPPQWRAQIEYDEHGERQPAVAVEP